MFHDHDFKTDVPQVDDSRFATDVRIEFSGASLWAMLAAAFEGGSNYWIERVVVLGMPAEKFSSIADVLFLGGSLEIVVDEDPGIQAELLTKATLERGLKLMPIVVPHHWANFMADTGDAITGDVFLQLCIFGEVVFG